MPIDPGLSYEDFSHPCGLFSLHASLQEERCLEAMFYFFPYAQPKEIREECRG